MSSMGAHQISLVQLVVGFGTAWITTLFISKSISLRSALKSLGNCRGKGILLLHPQRIAAHVGATIFPFKGMIGDYYGKFSSYKKYGSTCLASVALWNSSTIVWTADPDVFRVVSSDRPTFMKDTEAFESINIYGHNIVGTEGAEWKRHRDVARSAFNEANIDLVWEESFRVANEWFDADLAGKTDGEEINLLPAFENITLLVISSAGFGRRIAWTSASCASELDSHHSMSFANALRSSSHYFFLKAVAPARVYTLSQKIHIPWLTPALKNTTIAFGSLRRHMLEIISDARAARTGTTEIKSGLLANLVEANAAYNEDEVAGEKKKTLTDEELLSDTYVFLVAGHETSAHSLSFAVLLLAVHPDKQAMVFREVINLWPNGTPTSDSFTTFKESFLKLKYTTAVIHEAIRMFPPVMRLGRKVLQKVDVPIRAGSDVILDVLGLHMNPLAWGDDAENFEPERFIDTEGYRWPRDAFAGFSMGPRSCIGQRFALAEMVCVLALLIRKYEVLVPVSLEGKSMEEKKNRMLAWVHELTTTPKDARVCVKERSN